jgi:hypothetical protein
MDNPNHPRPPGTAREHAHVASGDFISSVHRVDAREGEWTSSNEKNQATLGETVRKGVMRPTMSERSHGLQDKPRDF